MRKKTNAVEKFEAGFTIWQLLQPGPAACIDHENTHRRPLPHRSFTLMFLVLFKTYRRVTKAKRKKKNLLNTERENEDLAENK